MDELLSSIHHISDERQLFALMLPCKNRCLSIRFMASLLSREPDWQRSLALLDWMNDEALYSPLVFTYNVVLRNVLFDEMRERALSPDRYTYSTLITQFGKEGLFNYALLWFHFADITAMEHVFLVAAFSVAQVFKRNFALICTHFHLLLRLIYLFLSTVRWFSLQLVLSSTDFSFVLHCWRSLDWGVCSFGRCFFLLKETSYTKEGYYFWEYYWTEEKMPWKGTFLFFLINLVHCTCSMLL